MNGLFIQVSAKAEPRDPLEQQEEALVYLIHMQKGPNPPLFGSWSFNNKATNFVSVSANLVMRCFHVFCGFLTSFGDEDQPNTNINPCIWLIANKNQHLDRNFLSQWLDL
jgi:hypothetical protein